MSVADMTSIKDLPKELTSIIVKSIEHDPVYLIKYNVTRASWVDDEEIVYQSNYVAQKLITFSGSKDDAKKHYPISDKIQPNDKLKRLQDNYEFPAYIQICKNDGWKTVKTSEYLQTGTTLELNDDPIHKKTIVILNLKRFA